MSIGALIKEKWDQPDGSAWDAATWTTIRNCRGTAAPPTTVNQTGRMTTVAGIECRILTALAPTLTDQDITVTHRDVTGLTMYSEIGYRVSDNVDTGVNPDRGYVLVIDAHQRRVWLARINSYDLIAQIRDVDIDNTDPHYYRILVKGSRHMVKVWHTEGAEPPLWGLDVFDSAYTSGRTFLGTWGDDALDSVTAEWDNLRVAEILPPAPGISMPQGDVVDVQIGHVRPSDCYVGATRIPLP